MKRVILLSGLVVVSTAAYLAGGIREQWLSFRRSPDTPRVHVTVSKAPGPRLAFADQQVPELAAPAAEPKDSLPQSAPAAKDSFIAAQSAPIPAQPVPDSLSRTNSLSPSQKRFLDLSEKKVRIMKEDQLRNAIDVLEREVEGFNALSKLDDAVKLLHEISEKYPQTHAAKAARAGLNAIQQVHTSAAAPTTVLPPAANTPVPAEPFDPR